MRLTRASSYALHALVYMATQKHNRPVPSHIVAQARGIPERFLLKVLKPLVSARVLDWGAVPVLAPRPQQSYAAAII